MPYPLQLLDAETVIPPNTGLATFTVGENFQPGDMRIVGLFWETQSRWSDGSSPGNYGVLTTPTGWLRRTNGTVSNTSHDITLNLDFTVTYGVPTYTRVLQAGDTDFPLTWSQVTGAYYWAVTLRNPNFNQSWSVGTNVSSAIHSYNSDGSTSYVSTMNHQSLSVVANSVALFFDIDSMTVNSGQASVVVPAASVTKLDSAGDGAALTLQLNTIGFNSSGSSGAQATQYGNSVLSPPYPQAVCSFYTTTTVILTQNPDVSVALGTATPNEVDTAGATTASLLNSVSFQIGTAVAERDTAGQVATPLTGYRISPPLALPQYPITNSVIHWDQFIYAAGSTVLVETSVDNGLTWQVATNDAPVPRLIYGYNSATTVISRVTLYRAKITDPTPRVANLEIRVATDSSQNELVSLGVFYITSTDIQLSGGSGTGSGGSGGGGSGVTGSGGGSTGGGLTIQISGVDQSRQVSRNTWQDVYYIAANTNYATAIQSIIDNRLPGLAYNFQSTPMKTPKIVLGTQLGNDPWQDAQDMATAIGFQLFFDAAGVCTLREVPNPATGQSVWTFSDSANPTIAQLDRTLTDQTTYNYVIVYGESVDNAVPVQAVAFDNDPNSPTYYLGPYGIVSTTFQSPQITTTAQAQQAANALLLAVKGASENVALTVVPNPALEPGDVVTVNVSDAQVSGTFLINDLQTPLSAAQGQTLTVYRQSS